MSRLSRFATLLAFLVAVGALAFLMRSPTPGAEPVSDLAPDAARQAPTSASLGAEHIQGGIYAGTVLDTQDRPIPGARVLLVAYGTGAPDMATAGQGADDAPIMRVGNHTIAGEGIADEQGAFRIAADSQSMVTRVLAYHVGHFLDVVEVKRPREDLRLRLQPAGRVIGTVVDDKTGQPVPRAVVDIYLQQKVAPLPEGAEKGGYVPFKRPQHETSWLVTLGRFISRDLGKRIWDVADSGSETIRVYTDDNGQFEFGPIGNSVQLEFVITHARYMWYDFDTDGGKKAPRRTVVQPGETVERTFRLKPGKHIAGQVVDDEGKGLPEVQVKVQSISAYYRHWWYRSKWRYTRTDAEGRFRVDGLADGAQEVVLTHPSFKSKTMSAKAGTDDLLVVADRFGAIEGRVDGIASRETLRTLTVILESLEKNPVGERRMRKTAMLTKENTFLVQRVAPGRYRVWIKAGKLGSQPVELTVEPLQTVTEIFEVGAGGSIMLRVLDDQGGLLDPASARLVSLQDGAERPMGTFVSREGELDIDGVAPGTYRLEVSAPGRITRKTETFQVARDRVTRLPAVELGSWAYLRFGQPTNERGRPAQIDGQLVLEIKREGADFERILAAGIERPVEPGTYTVRARTDSTAFESSVTVGSGETKDVEIVLLPR